jgi:glycosyltransferase involved in cell wall biosynthesis
MLLIGGGEQDAELRDLVKSFGLQGRVIFTGFVPFDDLPRYMKLADVAINTLHPTLVAHVAFPHKVLQYMATGIPTVTTKLDGLYSAFGDDSGLTWISNANEAVARSIDLLAKPDMLESVRKSQLSAVKRLFALDNTVDSLESLLERVSSEGK